MTKTPAKPTIAGQKKNGAKTSGVAKPNEIGSSSHPLPMKLFIKVNYELVGEATLMLKILSMMALILLWKKVVGFFLHLSIVK